MKRAVFITKGMNDKVQYRMRIEADDMAELGGQLLDPLIIGSSVLHHHLSKMWKEETIAVWRQTLDHGSWTHICIGMVPESQEDLQEALLQHIRNDTPVEYYRDEMLGLHMHVATSEAGMEEAIVFPFEQFHGWDVSDLYRGEILEIAREELEVERLGLADCRKMLPSLFWETVFDSDEYAHHFRGEDYKEQWSVDVFFGDSPSNAGWSCVLKEGEEVLLKRSRAANPAQVIWDMVVVLQAMEKRGAQIPSFLTNGPDIQEAMGGACAAQGRAF